MYMLSYRNLHVLSKQNRYLLDFIFIVKLSSFSDLKNISFDKTRITYINLFFEKKIISLVQFYAYCKWFFFPWFGIIYRKMSGTFWADQNFNLMETGNEIGQLKYSISVMGYFVEFDGKTITLGWNTSIKKKIIWSGP